MTKRGKGKPHERVLDGGNGVYRQALGQAALGARWGACLPPRLSTDGGAGRGPEGVLGRRRRARKLDRRRYFQARSRRLGERRWQARGQDRSFLPSGGGLRPQGPSGA